MRAPKKKSIELCHFLASYHCWPAGRALSYETFVGLYLNRRLALLSSSASLAIGIGIMSGQEPPLDVFRALYDTDAEAGEAAWEHAAEAMRQRVVGKRWGGDTEHVKRVL